MFAAVVVLGIAALIHLVRYLLLIVNRNTLLNSAVAAAALWLGVLASLAAVLAVIVCTVTLIRWLIARRAAAYAALGLPDPRPAGALWMGVVLPPSVAIVAAMASALLLAKADHPPSWAVMAVCIGTCCLPLAALVWPLVYVVELASTEDRYTRLGEAIWGWWLLWLLSAVTSVFATTTGGAHEAQGIANNTVAITVAYLLASGAVLATARVFEGFERKPVGRPAHRWVVVADDRHGAPESTRAVEPEGEEPAA